MSKRPQSPAKRGRPRNQPVSEPLFSPYLPTKTPAFRREKNTAKSTRAPTHSQAQMTQTACEDEEYADQDFDNIFIDPEEERRIQCLLQFARQGKITPSNAFEIPLKLIDPQLTEGTLRFWKFASQLLGASMCIYDKRVESMFLATNQTFSSFIRSTAGEQQPAEEETLYQKSKRKRAQAMREDFDRMKMNPKINMLEIACMNLEEAHKVNCKSEYLQFLKSPLFNKTLQAFDCSTLNGLFLNIFQIAKNGEIIFLCEIQQAKDEKTQVKECLELEESFPQWLETQLEKLGFLARSTEIYACMSQFISKHPFKHEGQRSRLDLTQDLLSLQQWKQGKEIMEGDNFTVLTSKFSEDIEKFSFNFDEKSNPKSQIVTISQKSAFSQPCSKYLLVIQDDNWSVLDPRQLQFRGLMLNKKKISRKPPRDKERIEVCPEISFEFDDESREQVLKSNFPSEIYRKRSYQQRFLLPISMQPYRQFHYNKRRLARQSQAFQTSQQKQHHIYSNQFPLAQVPPDNDLTRLYQESSPQEMYGSWKMEELSTEGLRNIRIFGLRSIREIKQDTKGRIQIQGRLTLSELRLPISPASAFIMLLHLVNQQNLTIQSLDSQRDVSIHF